MCKNLDLNSHLPKPPPVEEKPKEDGDKKAAENKTTEKEAKESSDEKVSKVVLLSFIESNTYCTVILY